jgi:hypothetical protein
MEGKAIIDFMFQYIGIEDIVNPDVKDLVLFLNDRYLHGEVLTPDEIINQIENENIQGMIAGLIAKEKIFSKEAMEKKYKTQLDNEKWAIDLIKRFKVRQINLQLDHVYRIIKEYQNQKLELEEYQEVLSEYQRLMGEKQEWENAK